MAGLAKTVRVGEETREVVEQALTAPPSIRAPPGATRTSTGVGVGPPVATPVQVGRATVAPLPGQMAPQVLLTAPGEAPDEPRPEGYPPRERMSPPVETGPLRASKGVGPPLPRQLRATAPGRLRPRQQPGRGGATIAIVRPVGRTVTRRAAWLLGVKELGAPSRPRPLAVEGSIAVTALGAGHRRASHPPFF